MLESTDETTEIRFALQLFAAIKLIELLKFDEIHFHSFFGGAKKDQEMCCITEHFLLLGKN